LYYPQISPRRLALLRRPSRSIAAAMDAIDAELAQAQEERRKMEETLAAGAPMAVTFDTDLYSGGGSDPNRFAGYDTSIPASEDDAAEEEADAPNRAAPPCVLHGPRHRPPMTSHARPTTTGCPRGPSASSTARTTTAAAVSTRSSPRSTTTRSQPVRPLRTPLCGPMPMSCVMRR
jgi:hypothetical protein